MLGSNELSERPPFEVGLDDHVSVVSATSMRRIGERSKEIRWRPAQESRGCQGIHFASILRLRAHYEIHILVFSVELCSP